jgi:iron(III) transport system substrate-binding protein
MSVALLEKQFGWEFFDKLRANGARIGKGSGQVVDDTASGELAASLAVDYITNDKIARAHISPCIIRRNCCSPQPGGDFQGEPEYGGAKKFVDYLLRRRPSS